MAINEPKTITALQEKLDGLEVEFAVVINLLRYCPKSLPYDSGTRDLLLHHRQLRRRNTSLGRQMAQRKQFSPNKSYLRPIPRDILINRGACVQERYWTRIPGQSFYHCPMRQLPALQSRVVVFKLELLRSGFHLLILVLLTVPVEVWDIVEDHHAPRRLVKHCCEVYAQLRYPHSHCTRASTTRIVRRPQKLFGVNTQNLDAKRPQINIASHICNFDADMGYSAESSEVTASHRRCHCRFHNVPKQHHPQATP